MSDVLSLPLLDHELEEDELVLPNCAIAGLVPANRISGKPSNGWAHTPSLNCLSKNPHMIVAILDARALAKT